MIEDGKIPGGRETAILVISNTSICFREHAVFGKFGNLLFAEPFVRRYFLYEKLFRSSLDKRHDFCEIIHGRALRR